MDSDVDTEDRKRVVQAFAPKHNDRPDWAGTEKEVDLLISTDVLRRMRETYGDENAGGEGQSRKAPLGREHLRLVCFDMVNG